MLLRTPRLLYGALLAGVAVGLWLSATGRAADDAADKSPADTSRPAQAAADATELSTFMRKKLDASNQILEGLTTDDLEMVKDGARKLREMSTAERFRVSNDPIYRQFNGDFHEITQQLIKAAEDGNADRAAMKWMDATISCLDCHRFVRGMHIAQE